MVKSAMRKEAVGLAMSEYGLSERRACRLLDLSRSVRRWQSRRRDDHQLRARLLVHAKKRRRWGYRRLHILLRRDGFVVNHKRVLRLYRQEGLLVRKKKRKRLAAGTRVPRLAPATRPNERWSMDFCADSLCNGRALRTFNVVDVFTRECLAIEVDTSLPGLRVVRVLAKLIAERGKPEMLVSDNGPEFIGNALDSWAYKQKIELHFITPGKPTENAHVESFNGKFRDECLNEHWFLSVADARRKIEAHRVDYNEVRPHSALGNLTPKEFVARFAQLRSPPAPYAEQNVSLKLTGSSC
jgi:putative transposase